MCGIVGYIGSEKAAPHLLAGLARLAYRGYDSAGIALAGKAGFTLMRAEGKLERLSERVGDPTAYPSTCGIAHTRWATHGAPTEQNAHPHLSFAGDVSVVHNGIIENYRTLRARLVEQGIPFASQTDTEVIPHLLSLSLAAGASPKEAILALAKQLEGAYALAILFRACPDQIWAVRRHSPLAVAYGETGALLASDMPALAGKCTQVTYLEEGDIACLSPDGFTLFDARGYPVTRPAKAALTGAREIEKGGFSTYMEKELCEAPAAVAKTVAALTQAEVGALPRDRPTGICFLGCGSAWHVGVLGKYLIEEHLGIPVQVEPASEMRYRHVPLPSGSLAVAISQSGETADTLAAARVCREAGIPLLGIVNVDGSALTREATYHLPTQAGPELAVATTKAYCAQVAALLVLVARLCQGRGKAALADEILRALSALPEAMEQTLARAARFPGCADALSRGEHAFYLGRGLDYAAAMEGALKLKEISYVHAEAYPAGELKHGTISLVSAGTPVLAAITQPNLAPKALSGVEEVQCRGANTYLIVGSGIDVPPGEGHILRLPPASPFTAPLLATLAMQRIALDACLARGIDPDRPRNLAKSVTVE